jgi:hypothetical protein
MNLIFTYAWVAFIFVTVVNYFILRQTIQKHIDLNADLKTGYDNFFKSFLILGNIPWVIIGIGMLTGQTNSVFDFFHPKLLNPIVLTFHLYAIIVFILSIYWIYFKNGADFFTRHPGIIRFQGFGKSKDITSTMSIKLFFAIVILGGIAGLTMMWLIDFPTPNFK